MNKLDFTLDPRTLEVIDKFGVKNQLVLKVAGYPENVFSAENSKKKAQSIKVMGRIFAPILLDFVEDDYEKMIRRIGDESFTYFVGTNFIMLANSGAREVYLYMWTQNQHCIVQGKMFDKKGFVFYKFNETYPVWVYKSIELSLNKTPVSEPKPEPAPVEDLLTVEDEELLKDIERQYYAIAGEPVFEIKTRVFTDSGRFDTNYADQPLDSKDNPVLVSFVPACINNNITLELTKEIVILLKKKSIAVSTGKWYINNKFMYHYMGSNGTKLIYIGENELEVFPMERKATSNGIFHTVSLPVGLVEEYENFKTK